MKLKYVKGLTLGLCITLMSTTAVLATERNTIAPDTPVSSAARDEFDTRSQLQKDIDKKLFEDYSLELSKQGINITHTVQIDDYIEIGILPYNDENVKFLNDLLKESKTKIIEGTLYTIMPADVDKDQPITEPAIEPYLYSEKALETQLALDQHLFKDNGKIFEEKGFKILHTLPVDDYVQIGILPYSEENADFLYELLGKDKIKVVEVEENELMRTSAVSEVATEVAIAASDSSEEANKNDPLKAPLVYGLGAITLLGGGFIVLKRK